MRYDPWHHARQAWPEIRVLAGPLPGDLLGVLRYPVIVLRAGTTVAQQRCTLAHELVHLERGIGDSGPWSDREERLVHREAARRLIGLTELCDAVAAAGGTDDLAALAHTLDVDGETLSCRLEALSAAERDQVRATVRARGAAA